MIEIQWPASGTRVEVERISARDDADVQAAIRVFDSTGSLIVVADGAAEILYSQASAVLRAGTAHLPLDTPEILAMAQRELFHGALQ